MMKIRKATLADNLRMTEILNQAIEAGNATAILETFIPEDRLDWLQEHMGEKYIVYVAEMDGQVVGWLSLSPYRKGRQAFKHLAEITYYIDYAYHRKGIARALYEKALEHCCQHEIKDLVAFLYADNKASVEMLKKLGFSRWGLFPNTIYIHHKTLDHVIYGKHLKE
ncbi:MAG: GNAT family N-acetyltransferase [Bacteroidetes bacterium]|nr:GNAT family N-acetyltransferase [Bacteroidota bacterium]